jgi:hypothetical protein
VSVKLDRARHHLAEIREEYERVLGPNAFTNVVTPLDAERRRFAVRVEGLKPLRDDFSALVGDCLHNVRSALDHIADGLIRHAGLLPTRGTFFPIVAQVPNEPVYIRPAPGPDPEAIRVVTSVQPDVLGGGAHPLLFLNELSNADKHRELLFAVTVVEGGSWGLPIDVPSPRVNTRLGAVADGDEVARFEFARPWPPAPSLAFAPALDLRISIEPPTGYNGPPGLMLHRVDELLSSIVFNVSDYIVPQLERFIS